MKVIDEAHAKRLNDTGHTDPYLAANGHMMVAPLRNPIRGGAERPIAYRVGDEVRYDSWAATCAESCDHSESGPPEDW